MILKKINMALSAFLLMTTALADPSAETVTVTCPTPTELISESLVGSYAKYHYKATTPINMIEVNNALVFEGNADAPSAHTFSGATWSDNTLVCLYDYSTDAIVIAENQLGPHVQRCYFENKATPTRDSCTSSVPTECILTCERGAPDL